jgi:hypothetical protein
MEETKGTSPRRGLLLWILAFLLMAGAAVYQRLTGPTHPLRAAVEVDGVAQGFRLPRSEETVRDARVAVPSPGGAVGGTLRWRRYPTAEDFTAVALQLEPAVSGLPQAVAVLPAQPAAGKVEYHLELTVAGAVLRVPEAADEQIVLRFKDPVPGWFLWPHVLVMFVSILVGMRAGLAAIAEPSTMRRYAWVTLVGLFAGGLVLGPIVQKHAFGAYWTGFPWGSDLTDNKQLLMWLVWLLACGVLAAARGRVTGAGRVAVVAASLLMFAVYLIPHSLRGSQLDYGRLGEVADPKQAIETGR